MSACHKNISLLYILIHLGIGCIAQDTARTEPSPQCELKSREHAQASSFMRAYHQKDYLQAQSWMAKLLESHPDLLLHETWTRPIAETYARTQKLLDIEPQLLEYIAEHYNEIKAYYYQNLLYNAQTEKNKEYKRSDQKKIKQAILGSNSEASEYRISMPITQNEMLLSRREKVEEICYKLHYQNEEWSDPKLLDFMEINEGTLSAASIDAIGRYLLFTECMNRNWQPMAGGGCDIFFSTLQDKEWSAPVKFGAGINTPAYEGHAFLSPDHQYLFFSSNRDGGYGGLDIWYSTWNSALWSEPINAGPEINSSQDEISSYLSMDGRRFYFASDRNDDFDLFVSDFEDGRFSLARNLGPEVNSSQDEISMLPLDELQEIIVSRGSLKHAQPFDFVALPYELQKNTSLRRSISGQTLYSTNLDTDFMECGIWKDMTLLAPRKFNNPGNGWYLWNLDQEEFPTMMSFRNLDTHRDVSVFLPYKKYRMAREIEWNFLLLY